MVILEQNIVNNFAMRLNNTYNNISPVFKIEIIDLWNQKIKTINLIDTSPNKNVFNLFTIEVTDDIDLEDLANRIVFLKKTRYRYKIYESNIEVDYGYLTII
jgi:hypothetical protein